MNEGMKIRGLITITVRDNKNGTIKETAKIENGVTLLGFENINDLLTGLGGSPITHLGIGWGVGSDTAFSNAQTDFQGTDQDRAVVTPTKLSNTEIEIVHTWIATEPSGAAFPITIHEIGTFLGIAPNKMLTRAVRPAGIIKDSADELEINYKLTLLPA